MGIKVNYTKKEILEILKKHAYNVSGNPDIDLNNHDVDFISTGDFDSLHTVEFIMELETEFNISFSEKQEISILDNCSINNLYNILTTYITPSDE